MKAYEEGRHNLKGKIFGQEGQHVLGLNLPFLWDLLFLA